MKRPYSVSSHHRTRGSALLAALCFATVLAVSLGSYMTLCYRTLALSSRTVQGTRSVELAEAGMEDALWALNKNDWSAWTTSGTTATRTVSGFTFDGGVTGSIALTVTNYNNPAAIRTVTVTGSTRQPDGTVLLRTLTSTSTRAPLFVNAVAALGSTVTFSSGGTVDSYDSRLGDYATQTPSYSAILSSSQASPTAANVSLVNAQIKGYVATSYSGGPSYSTSATLRGPTTPGTTKIDATRVSSSPYQPVFDLLVPGGAGTTLLNPASGTTTTIGVATDTVPRVYYCSGLDMRGANTRIVVDGPVQIVMTGTSNFYVGLTSGTATTQIQITANGSLEVFSAGDIAIYGGGIANATKDPKKCAIYSTTTSTAPDMSTTTPYHGVVYLTRGTFTVRTNNVIYGALVANKVAFTCTAPVVHYDLDLRNIEAGDFRGLDMPYAISNWRETDGI